VIIIIRGCLGAEAAGSRLVHHLLMLKV
jgi:hypothetical protein